MIVSIAYPVGMSRMHGRESAPSRSDALRDLGTPAAELTLPGWRYALPRPLPERGCWTAVRSLRSPLPQVELLGEERVTVAKALPKRVSEFSKGRACARAALADLGVRRIRFRSAPWKPALEGRFAWDQQLVFTAVCL